MAKVKLQLTANPTFKAPVPIPVPGGKITNVEFTFKHRNKTQMQEFLEALKDQDDVDLIMSMASGWELDEPFDAENVGQMVSEYVGSAIAVLETYIAESTGTAHRTKK